MSRRVRVRERVPVETGAVGTDWFLFFFSHERIKLVSVHLFLFLGFYGFGLGWGFGLLRIEKSRPLPCVSRSLSKERKCAGLFRPLRTSANECKRRPTDRLSSPSSSVPGPAPDPAEAPCPEAAYPAAAGRRGRISADS